MCGFSGCIDYYANNIEIAGTAKIMTEALSYQNSGRRGIWNGKYASLGYQNLNIINKHNSTQPMEAKDHNGHNAVIAFNGQVFNFIELREELKSYGYQFETNSDTEVLLKGYLHWGTDIVHHLNGMYATAIWDCNREQLFLFRDRMGIKPLYYALTDSGIVFSSEIKAIFASLKVNPCVSRDGFCELLDMLKTPERTIYDGVFEIRPGTSLVFNKGGLNKITYWSLQAKEHTDNLDMTINTVRNILTDTVKKQIISDAPLCSLLSGGLDSSAITSMAANEITDGRLPSFSLDFTHNIESFQADGVRGAPDAPFARLLAKHAGTQHTELLLNSEEMLDDSIRQKVLKAVDAPPAYWGDMWPSLYLLFRELKKYSSVALSGEGADEVFGGYQWFRNPAAQSAETFPWLTAGSSRYFGGSQLVIPPKNRCINK
ncbi:asparagine synthase (glutamine-hydrolyzing) [Providencia stuartii]|uniref:asparagine synthase (glutamine-hydrolyzing) n=1 Tax=Providencia stuartii TaxID=588 RepID=UPI0028BFDB7A|nr:asparagine synthase (glutamine-hydrolyzing) [Providencia stuartii]MDT7052271.1 asparagine synthase (glutamine-hydrolyzing) [Providencia stuartii]